MGTADTPFSGMSSQTAGEPLQPINPIPPTTPPTPASIKVEAEKEEKHDVAAEKAKVVAALEKANAKVQQEREAKKAAANKADEAKAARPLRVVAVEGQIYNQKLKRIESILHRSNQSVQDMVRDIDTVIKE